MKGIDSFERGGHDLRAKEGNLRATEDDAKQNLTISSSRPVPDPHVAHQCAKSVIFGALELGNAFPKKTVLQTIPGTCKG